MKYLKWAAGLVFIASVISLVARTDVAKAASEQELSTRIDDLQEAVARLEKEVESLKKNRLSIVTEVRPEDAPRMIPAPPRQHNRDYPWEPYYDGFAFEPKAHFAAELEIKTAPAK
ncbi:MAG: hypothetical protein AMXMBFR84_19070 [Candidatus Hydrogenedentota bacterium]